MAATVAECNPMSWGISVLPKSVLSIKKVFPGEKKNGKKEKHSFLLHTSIYFIAGTGQLKEHAAERSMEQLILTLSFSYR